MQGVARSAPEKDHAARDDNARRVRDGIERQGNVAQAKEGKAEAERKVGQRGRGPGYVDEDGRDQHGAVIGEVGVAGDGPVDGLAEEAQVQGDIRTDRSALLRGRPPSMPSVSKSINASLNGRR